MVGSSQWRFSPTSRSRNPSRRSSFKNKTWEGRLPGSGGGSVRLHSMLCQACSGLRALRVRERPMASMRLRVASSNSSASSSRRASNRSRSVASGSAMRASARASRSAAWAASSFSGKTSHSNDPKVGAHGRASAPAVRARTWRRIRRRNASDGLGRAGSMPSRSGSSSCMRLDQSEGGSALAACRAASSGVVKAGRSATRSSSRLARPRARDLPPSAPRSQRRSSAVSPPESAAENALSAAPNTWWPSSKT